LLSPARPRRHRRAADAPPRTLQDEFLFAPHSAFTVVSVTWSGSPHWTRPHEVVLGVAPDNKDAPEDLSLAPWC